MSEFQSFFSPIWGKSSLGIFWGKIFPQTLFGHSRKKKAVFIMRILLKSYQIMSHIDWLNQIKVHQFCNRYLNIVYLLKLHNKKLLNEPMKVPVSVIAKVLSTTLAIDFVSII